MKTIKQQIIPKTILTAFVLLSTFLTAQENTIPNIYRAHWSYHVRREGQERPVLSCYQPAVQFVRRVGRRGKLKIRVAGGYLLRAPVVMTSAPVKTCLWLSGHHKMRDWLIPQRLVMVEQRMVFRCILLFVVLQRGRNQEVIVACLLI